MSATDETLDSRASGDTERVPITETLVRGQIVDGRYEIGELLGQGAMGSVVSARHVVLNTRLAIKVMRPELTLDAEALARFRQEAQVVGAIGHPNIVDVRDFGTLPAPDGVSPGASYLVMERLEGRELGAVLSEDGPFSVERAVHVVQQMAEALDAAHARGVVHRDVKPANTLLVARGAIPIT
jgi:serine/threonine protein kinase